VAAVVGDDEVGAALDLLELVELAWHDCYGEITPSDAVVDDVLVLSGGTLAGLVVAARLAVTDWRDLRIAADALRS
jgi:hypothetical protein